MEKRIRAEKALIEIHDISHIIVVVGICIKFLSFNFRASATLFPQCWNIF
jgi:hypothetical protein